MTKVGSLRFRFVIVNTQEELIAVSIIFYRPKLNKNNVARKAKVLLIYLLNIYVYQGF